MLTAISNTDFEGEIKGQGDTVHIRREPRLEINDYAKGQKITYGDYDYSMQDLLIDKGKFWAFRNDDIDKAQSDLNFVSAWTAAAAQQLKVVIDTEVLAAVPTGAHTYNKGASAGRITQGINLGTTGSPLQVSKTNILDTIVQANQCLDEQNIPEEGRWLVLPAWAISMIKMSDIKDASLSGDGTSVLRNGRVGMIDRTEIFLSNLLSTTTDTGHKVFNCIFGHKQAITFATQLTENEGPIRSAEFFGDLYRGLVVYGLTFSPSVSIH